MIWANASLSTTFESSMAISLLAEGCWVGVEKRGSIRELFQRAENDEEYVKIVTNSCGKEGYD